MKTKKRVEALLNNQITILANQKKIANMLEVIGTTLLTPNNRETPLAALIKSYFKDVKDDVCDWRSPKRIEKMRKKREAYLEKENEE